MPTDPILNASYSPFTWLDNDNVKIINNDWLVNVGYFGGIYLLGLGGFNV